MKRPFVDTNILLYAFGQDERSTVAAAIMGTSGAVAVQSLNEFANVARRKLRLAWPEIRQALAEVRTLCAVQEGATPNTHEQALELAERYLLNIHDAMLLAIALEAGCDTFLSEDRQDGLVVENRLKVRNTFAD